MPRDRQTRDLTDPLPQAGGNDLAALQGPWEGRAAQLAQRDGFQQRALAVVDTADDDALRIEDIHQHGQPTPEIARHQREHLACQRVATLGGVAHRVRRHGRQVRARRAKEGRAPPPQPVIRHGARQVGDPTPAAPAFEGSGFAIANGSVGVQADVSDLAGHAGRPLIEAPIQDEAGPHARPEGQEDDAVTAAPRPPQPLGERARVRVVPQRRGDAEVVAQRRHDINAIPAR